MNATAEAVATLARIQEASFARAGDSSSRAFPEDRRMDGPALAAFLNDNPMCVLATSRPDGRPHAMPAGFALVGVRIVVPSRADAPRIANLRHDPRCSMVVTASDDSVVVADGTARLVEPIQAPLEMREPFRDAAGGLPPWVELLIAITPERVLSRRG